MSVRLFLCGDVMTGRGIDQILPHPAEPVLFEPVIRDARSYIALAEARNGPIPRPMDFAYIWGDALTELDSQKPDLRIVNLETSITNDGVPANKEIHYRMGPGNVPCLTAAKIDCCVLANNHILDWGRSGLLDTLDTLSKAVVRTAGAGANHAAAAAPAILPFAKDRRLLVFGYGHGSAGVPAHWSAKPDGPGISLLRNLSASAADEVIAEIGQARRSGDLAVASLHWGGNWGYEVSAAQRAFARRLIDSGSVDLVHGHSSHHFRPLEIWRGKLILYSCGDLLNDYEGIGGYEEYRDDLGIMYFPTLAAEGGALQELTLVPMRVRRMRLIRPSSEDRAWLGDRLNRECAQFGLRFVPDASGALRLLA
jgi:poly-gamma-glutamate capsule biosynthesis protein CapA/YwtB (metallophosphatase superfamily)